MRDETVKDNRQTAALICQDLCHGLTGNNELGFSSTRSIQFYRFQLLKVFFLKFGVFIVEREKMGQSQAMFLCVCFTCSSKGHDIWL